MAYADDRDQTRWSDLTEIAQLLARYNSAPENLSVAQLATLTQALHAVAQGRGAGYVPVAELAQQLRAKGLGNVSFDVVAKLTDLLSTVSPEHDATEYVTLAQARRLLAP